MKLTKLSKRACTINNIEYESMAAAARTYGISRQLVEIRIKSPFFPMWFAVGKPGVEEISMNYLFEGKQYHSIQEIIDATGLSRAKIMKRIDDPDDTECQKLNPDWHKRGK